MKTKQKEETASYTARAVARFRTAEKALAAFMADPDNVEILDQYSELIAERNSCLDATIKVLKSDIQRSDKDKLVVDGLGVQKRVRTEYDVDVLRESLPKDKQDLCITKRVVYDLDENQLLALVRMEEVDKKVVEKARRETQQIAVIPGMPKAWIVPPMPGQEGGEADEG